MKSLKYTAVVLVLLVAAYFFVLPAAMADTIVFADPVLENKVRGMINKENGDITVADVETVTVLDFGYFGGDKIADLHGLERFPALEGVCLNRQAVADLSPLAAVSSLTYIEIGDAGLEDIASLRGAGVRELLLYGNQIEDLTPLADMTQLEVLVLEGNNIRDVGPLAGLSNLRVLILGDNPISDYTPLEDIYDQLEEKDFELTKAEAILFADPVLEAKIREIIGKPEGDITTADVEGFTVLDFEEPGGELITDLSGLEYFTSLEVICMTGQAVADISALAGLEHLDCVDLGECRISDLAPLSGKEIRELYLYGNRIGDVSPLQDMQSLEVLVLSGNEIGDVGPLAGLSNLRELHLCENAILDFTPLEAIYDQLEEKDFELIKAEVITFADPVLEREIRAFLDRPAGDVTTMDVLYVDWIELCWDGGERITDLSGLEAFENLSSLKLSEHGITDITPLAGLDNLRDLDLGGNQITDISALEGMALEHLALWGNQIEDISPLRDMDTLEDLDLCNNRITDISALKGMDNLRFLSLAGNGITDFSPVADSYDGIDQKDFELDTRTLMIRAGKDPDAVVTFDDPVLEGMIRGAIGKPEDDITAADAAAVTELNLEMDGGDASRPRISCLNGMEYFENLVALDLGWALDAGDEQVDLTPISALYKLERLTLQCDGIRDIGCLSGLTNMRELWIWANDISDISALAGMTRMESVWLFSNKVSDIGVLETMPALYRVLMADNRVMDLSPLAGLENLTVLEVSNNPVWDYQVLAEVYVGLTDTDFSPTDEPAARKPDDPDAVVVFSDSLLEQKVREQMNMPQGDITARDAAGVTELSFNVDWREDLTEDDFILSIGGLEYFINLQSLSMYNNGIDDLTPLQGLAYLEILDLRDNHIQDISPLEGLTKMKTLLFANNRVEDISALAGMTQLNRLELENNPVADYTPIRELYDLIEYKDFEYGQVFEKMYYPDDPDAVITFPDPALEAAVRNNIGVPEGDITAKMICLIDNLNIGNYTNVDPDRRIYDLTGLEHFLNLKHLDIGYQCVSDLTPLAGLDKLVYLKLYGNLITDITPLAGLVNLTELWLADNPITDYSPIDGIIPTLDTKDF